MKKIKVVLIETKKGWKYTVQGLTKKGYTDTIESIPFFTDAKAACEMSKNHIDKIETWLEGIKE